jgi:hypothetical protein
MMQDGRMNPKYARDAFHLTPAGYEALTRAVTPALDATTTASKMR